MNGLVQISSFDSPRPVLDRLKSLVPASSARDAVTLPSLAAGESYRFHFDMTRCIGCRCCEVACNEQNNNPAHVTWRRVGELESGAFPDVRRFHISMACNHCLEPACLEGCPVDAYTKLSNGIVHHDAETCIGCQYCTWTCPYGAPQFHPERHVVTKCHLCADRIGGGDLPACVEACPSTAIEIEKVNVAEWRAEVEAGSADANAPGLPPAPLTFSTTRFTLPDDLPLALDRCRAHALEPEAPHWPLVFLLVLSQGSVGLFAAAFAFALEAPRLTGATTLIAFVAGQVALAASVFHLGRPIHAIRAMKAWRHSWLSREVLAFSIFAAFGASAVSTCFIAGDSFAAVRFGLLALTVLSGVLGVISSAMIYLIPARPAWNTWRTPAQFCGTILLLGALGGLLQVCATPPPMIGDSVRAGLTWTLAGIAALAALSQALTPWTLSHKNRTTEESPLEGTAQLLTRRFLRLLTFRTVLLFAVAILAPVSAVVGRAVSAPEVPAAALALALFSELAGRYLFFVTVVPLDMPGHFFSRRQMH